MQAEGDDLVRRIVADIRPPEPWNSGALAPISGDRLRLGPERTVIFGDVADAPQPQPRQPARSKIAGDMKEGAIEGVEIFARSEEHTSELQSLMRISSAVFCLKKKTKEIRNKQE